MSATELTSDAYSLLRFYLREYDGLKEKRPSEKRESTKKVPTLFVPPVASCDRFKRVRGYRLCWNIGAVEIYRNGHGSSKNNVSSTFLRTLPSFPALSKSWAAALSALERFQERKLPMKSELKFRVTVLGLPRSSSGSTSVPETCTTQFVATWLGQGIREAFGWKVDLVGYDVEVVATLLTNETAARQVGVLSLGLTLCRATTSECLAGLLASQRSEFRALNPLQSKEALKTIHGHYVVNQMLSIANELNEPRASWCLVRRAIKSVYFRRKLLNVANKRGETPMILAAKACDSRLVSLILALGKRKLKENKAQPQLQFPHPHGAQIQLDRRVVPVRGDLMKRDNQQYDALMHSCERGDNSTVSVLLNHKSGTFNWGFNKLCERCLSVAAGASQHHTLSLVLHHLFNGKGSRIHPSLCWPALQTAIDTGHSLTVALLLDYMRMFGSRYRSKEEERMNSKSCHSNQFPIPHSFFSGLKSQSVFNLLCQANIFVLCGDRSVDMKSAFPSGVCSTPITVTSSPPFSSLPTLSSLPKPVSRDKPVSLLTCLLKEKSAQKPQQPSLPIPIKGTTLLRGKEIKKDDIKLSCGPPKLMKIESIGEERTKKHGREKKELKENLIERGIMMEFDGKGEEGVPELDEIISMHEPSTESASKNRISKPKKLRIVGGRTASSHFKFYESEKKRWLKQLLDDTNESQLCSSVIQLILTYVVV